MIKPELALLQMQVEGRAAHAAELHEPGLRHAPETFDAVDVRVASNELVPVVTHAIMLPIAHVNYSIVGRKAIGMNRRRQLDFAANNRLQTALFAVRYDLRINAPVSFVDAEDDGFATCATPALATDTTSAEVTFIEFDFTSEGRLSLTVCSNGLTNQSQITVDRVAVQIS